MENEVMKENVQCICCRHVWMDGVCPYCKLTGRDVEYEDSCEDARPVV